MAPLLSPTAHIGMSEFEFQPQLLTVASHQFSSDGKESWVLPIHTGAPGCVPPLWLRAQPLQVLGEGANRCVCVHLSKPHSKNQGPHKNKAKQNNSGKAAFGSELSAMVWIVAPGKAPPTAAGETGRAEPAG